MIKEKERIYEELEEKGQQIKEKLTDQVDIGGLGAELTVPFPDWREIFKSTEIKTKKMLLFSMIDQIEVKDESIHIKYKVGKGTFEPTHDTSPLKTIGFPVPE